MLNTDPKEAKLMIDATEHMLSIDPIDEIESILIILSTQTALQMLSMLHNATVCREWDF
jgi:hypothetical protein